MKLLATGKFWRLRKKIMKNCSKNIRFKFLFVLPRNNLFLDLQRINNGAIILIKSSYLINALPFLCVD